MTYSVIKTTPAHSICLSTTFNTLADARAYLADIRRAYANEAPRGFKRERAAWASDRLSLACETTNPCDPKGRGDLITFTITKE